MRMHIHDDPINIEYTAAMQLHMRKITKEQTDRFEGYAAEIMLHPYGVAVFLGVNHLCVEMRGMRETALKTRTTVWRGYYAEDASLRAAKKRTITL
jgi:GTP cyclohydrolase I